MKKRILIALSAVVLVVAMLMTTVGAKSFEDVGEGDWFFDAVDYVSDNGLMKGTNTEQTIFEPTRILTRAEMAVMLYNLEVNVYGEPEAADEAPFLDIEDVKSWAGTAINWAYANGIVKGTNADGTNFSPAVTLNRASMAVMFTNYIELKGLTDVVDISRVDDTVGSYTMFNDEFDWVNSDWYWAAVHYVGEVGLMGGKDSGNPDYPNFDPEGTASRAEAATVLARLHKFVSIPTLGAERAFALFNADYLCSVHSDVLLHYNKQGNMNGNTQASRMPELLNYADLITALDEKLVYDRDEYYFRIANKNEVLSTLSGAAGNGASANAVMELVRWDGSATVQNTVEIAMNQVSWNDENALHRQISIPLGNWACNDTEENYAEAIQADLDAKFAEFCDYVLAEDGKLYLKYEPQPATVKEEIGGVEVEVPNEWLEWVRQPLTLAFVNSGIGGIDYVVDIQELVDDSAYLSAERNDEDKADDVPGVAGANWTQELQDKKMALMADVIAGKQTEFTGELIFSLYAGRKDDSGNWANMPVASKEVTIVYVPDTDRAALLHGNEANVVIPTELKKEEITEFALCEECGKLHYICSDATITEESLTADFKDMDQVLFNANKYTVTAVKLDDAFKADLEDLGNLEIATGKATFTFADAYSMSKSLDVEIELTVQMNTNVKKSLDGRSWSQYTETLNVCPDSSDFFLYGFTAQEELDKFVAENTCEECGTIHINLKKDEHATVARVQMAILSKMDVRAVERTIGITTDTKTFLNNNFTDATLAAKTANGGIYTKEVVLIYGSSAYNDVATAVVTVDVRVNGTYSTSIVPTQNLVNEISGETFVTCPYNLENITAFEESVINAKVDKIVADKGTDGVIYAWYGLGFKTQGDWNDGNGSPAVRVYFDWAPREAYWLVTRFEDFTDCARAVVDDDGDLYYSEFTSESWDPIKKSGDDLKAAADKSLICENAELVIHFQTKTTGKDVYKTVKLTVGRDNRVGFPGNTKGDAWAFCKSIDDAMAAEKTAIQAAFDKVVAENAKDGVITIKMNGTPNYQWNQWRPGASCRLLFYIPGVEQIFKDTGMITAYQHDVAYLYGCMSKSDWDTKMAGDTNKLADGEIGAHEYTYEIRGAISGAVQEYKCTINYIVDNAGHLDGVGGIVK